MISNMNFLMAKSLLLDPKDSDALNFFSNHLKMDVKFQEFMNSLSNLS